MVGRQFVRNNAEAPQIDDLRRFAFCSAPLPGGPGAQPPAWLL